jgi:hypothetical protein
MTDQTAAAPDAAKPSDRGPLTMDQAVALTLERQRTAQAAAAPAPAEAQAPAEANPEQVEPSEAESVDDVQPEGDDATDESTEEATAADDGEGIVLDDTSRIVLPDGSEWTAKELAEGVLRHKDYTKKTQAVADDRKAVEAERKAAQAERQALQDKASKIDAEIAAELAAARAERERYAAQVAKIADAHKSHMAKWDGVNWDQLQAEDPVRASQLWMQRERDREAQQVIEAEQRELEAKRTAETEAERKKAEESYAQSWLQARTTLHEHVKANHATLADPVKGTAEWNAMAATLKSVGLTDDVIQAAFGARHDPNVPVVSTPIFELIRKATLYDQANAQHSKAIASPGAPKASSDGKIRVVKSTAPRFKAPPAEKAALGRAQIAFNRTGSFEDAKKLELAKMTARR